MNTLLKTIAYHSPKVIFPGYKLIYLESFKVGAKIKFACTIENGCNCMDKYDTILKIDEDNNEVLITEMVMGIRGSSTYISYEKCCF